MRQFCKEVLRFLKSEYNDAYKFTIEVHEASLARVLPSEYAELTIEITPEYKLKIANDNMRYLFYLYINEDFLEDRQQYRWQKELIDMIEGC